MSLNFYNRKGVYVVTFSSILFFVLLLLIILYIFPHHSGRSEASIMNENSMSTLSEASRFGIGDFRKFGCRSECRCDDDRRTVGVLSKSLYLVVSSVTAVIAVNYAATRFRESCRNEYTGVCSKTFVEDTDCDEIIEDEVDAFKGEKIVWKCTGRCVGMSVLVDFMKQEKQVSLLKREFEKQISMGELYAEEEKMKNCETHYSSARVRAVSLFAAITTFQRNRLKPFCTEVGTVERRIEDEDDHRTVCYGDLNTIVCEEES